MKIILLTAFILMCGCITNDPPPVLADSDIPHQMMPGDYKNTKGEIYKVDDLKPRWSVSEGYLFEAVTEEPEEKKEGTDWEQISYIVGLLLSSITAIIIDKKRRKSNALVNTLKGK